MTKLRSRAAASVAAIAVFSMTATPVLARGYDDWGRHRHHRHGDRIDGGDLLAGLLIVGGIAAIASAASKSSNENGANGSDREPKDGSYGEVPADGPDYPDGARADGGPDYGDPEDRDYGEAPEDSPDRPDGALANGGFDEAVERCADELERGEHRLDTVDNVGRTGGDSYQVEGRLKDGRGYACSVDGDGRVRSVAVDGHAMI